MDVIIGDPIDTARTVRDIGVAAGTETAVATNRRADTGMGATPATADPRGDVKAAMIDHPAGVLVIRAKRLARTRVLMINIGSAVVATRARSAIGPRIEGSAAIAKGSESGRRVKQRVHDLPMPQLLTRGENTALSPRKISH